MQFEASVQALNNHVHMYIDLMVKSANAASDLAGALAAMCDADAQKTGDPFVASMADASSRVARAMAGNATKTIASVRSTLVHGIAERLGDVLQHLPEVQALMKTREALATDCDAYLRMVR